MCIRCACFTSIHFIRPLTAPRPVPVRGGSVCIQQQVWAGRRQHELLPGPRVLLATNPIYTPLPCTRCVSARRPRLGSSGGSRSRWISSSRPGAGGDGACADIYLVGQIMPDEASMSPLGAWPLHGVCFRLSHAGLGGTAGTRSQTPWASRCLDGQTRACSLRRTFSVAPRAWVGRRRKRAEPGRKASDVRRGVVARGPWRRSQSLSCVGDPSESLAERLSTGRPRPPSGRPRPRRTMDILFGWLSLHRVVWGQGMRVSTAATVRETWVVQSLIRRSASFVVMFPQPGPTASTVYMCAKAGEGLLRCGVRACGALPGLVHV